MTAIYYSKKLKTFLVSYTLLYLLLIVLIPISSIFWKAGELSWTEFMNIAFHPRSLSAYRLSFLASLGAALINSVFGLVTAWVLVRYDFYGKRFFDSIVDFPFALPTAVAGLTFASLYSRDGWIGSLLGMQLSYTPFSIVLVLTFVSLPFVVRSVQPVLEDMDKEVEQAASSLGANRWQTFLYVTLPYLFPAWITGFTLSFARALGEYGSVIFIAGNLPFKSEISPLLIVMRLEQFHYAGASAIAIVLLGFSFSLLVLLNYLEKWSRRADEA
jgi:sulfate/thiosulfate transport system permease protein